MEVPVERWLLEVISQLILELQKVLRLAVGICDLAIQMILQLLKAIILLFERLMLIQLVLLALEAIQLVNLSKYSLTLVGVDQTELSEVDLALLVVVKDLEDEAIVFDWQLDAGELAAGHELLEAEAAVEVLIDAAESTSVVAPLLFDADVDLLEKCLDVLALRWGVSVHFELEFALLLAALLWLRLVDIAEGVHRDCVLEVVRVIVEVRRQHRTMVEDPLKRLQLLVTKVVLSIEVLLRRDLRRGRLIIKHVLRV